MKKDSRRSFQANEHENLWRGFLVDEDAAASLPFLARAVLARGDDPAIVREAWDERRTLVTSNRRNFVFHVRQFQNPPNDEKCRDLWGLVVIPNSHLLRAKGLTSISHGLTVPPGNLRWPGAALLNLYIHLTDDGHPIIRRFTRCVFCDHQERGVEIAEPWNTWYRSLPVVGSPEQVKAAV